MTKEEINKWLSNLKDDIGKAQHQELWHYAEALDMAIEALERKHGEWIEVYEDYRQQISWWECSVCKCGISWLSNFCPECGADMRGEE